MTRKEELQVIWLFLKELLKHSGTSLVRPLIFSENFVDKKEMIEYKRVKQTKWILMKHGTKCVATIR